jgi:hypothetical protein
VNKKLFFLLLLMPVAVFAQSTGGDPLSATLSSLYRILVGAAGIIASIFIIWSDFVGRNQPDPWPVGSRSRAHCRLGGDAY